MSKSKRIVTSKRRTVVPAERVGRSKTPIGGSDTPVRHRAQPDTEASKTRLRRVSDKSVRPTNRGVPPTKKTFDLDNMIARIRAAVAPFPKAAMFELAERGYDSVFHVLVGCIISIRTLDEVSLPTSLKLFEAAPTPEKIAKLSVRQIDDLIHACSFHEPKAKQIKEIARRTVEEFGGKLPCDFDVLTSFHGVGPKCANLALGIACDQASGVAGISVDIHVHRVTNRWGLVAMPTPEKTMEALKAILPKQYWIEINALLVPFGKHICTGALPKCSRCPVLAYCRQVGVTKHR
jgi:endonuclease-3